MSACADGNKSLDDIFVSGWGTVTTSFSVVTLALVARVHLKGNTVHSPGLPRLCHPSSLSPASAIHSTPSSPPPKSQPDRSALVARVHGCERYGDWYTKEESVAVVTTSFLDPPSTSP